MGDLKPNKTDIVRFTYMWELFQLLKSCVMGVNWIVENGLSFIIDRSSNILINYFILVTDVAISVLSVSRGNNGSCRPVEILRSFLLLLLFFFAK